MKKIILCLLVFLAVISSVYAQQLSFERAKVSSEMTLGERASSLIGIKPETVLEQIEDNTLEKNNYKITFYNVTEATIQEEDIIMDNGIIAFNSNNYQPKFYNGLIKSRLIEYYDVIKDNELLSIKRNEYYSICILNNKSLCSIQTEYTIKEYYDSGEIGYIEFYGCENNKAYQIVKSNEFTDIKEDLNIIYGYYDCIDNKLTIPINSFSSYGYNNVTIDTGITAVFKFDNTTYNYINKSNLTLRVGTEQYYTDEIHCSTGSCLYFDGNTGYDLVKDTLINSSLDKYNANYTLCGYFFQTACLTGTRTMFNDYNTVGVARGTFMGTQVGCTGRTEQISTDGDNNIYYTAVANIRQFICQQRNNTVYNIYINGKLNTSVGVSSGTTSGNRIMEIGGVPGYFYTGTMDDIVLWNRSLTSSEINWLWNNGTPLNLSNITGLNSNSIYLNGTNTLGLNALYNVSIYNITNNLISTTQYSGNNLISFPNNSILYINSTDYLNVFNITTNASNQTNYNISFYSINLTINIIDVTYNILISNANINISNNTYGYSNTTTIITGSELFYLESNTNYSINVTNLGYVNNYTIYNTSSKGSYTLNISLKNGGSLFLKDEQSESLFNISSPSFITEYIYCNDGSIYPINITSATLTYPLFCNTTKIKFVVVYPTDRYYRTILTNKTNISNTTVWLINLDTTQMIFNTFEIFDLTNTYHNISLYLTKNINFVDYFITGDYIDVEKKIGAYLMFGEEYTLHIESNEAPSRVFGFYTANEAGNKVIKLLELTTGAVPTGQYEKNYWYIDVLNVTPNDEVSVTWNADSSTFSEIFIDVYVMNESNNSYPSKFYSTSSAANQGQLLLPIPDAAANQSLLIQGNITRTAPYGAINFSQYEYISNGTSNGMFYNLITAGYVTQDTIGWWSLLFLSSVVLIFGVLSSNIGAIIICFLIIVFSLWFKILGVFGSTTKYVMSGAVIGFIILIAVINWWKNRERGAV